MKKNKPPMTLPPIPIEHLTIAQFEELREAIYNITGYKIIIELNDKKTKKKLATI